jgi:tape measure domain-containing protein
VDKDVKIRIKIDSETAKLDNLNNKVNTVSNSFNKADSITSSLTKRLLALGTAYVSIDGAISFGKMFINQADSIHLLDSRLKLATNSISEYKAQQERLLKISLDSYTLISDTTTLYTKLDPALKQLGATTGQVNNITSSFTKGLQLGGAQAAETSSAILQFSQSMGSGILRGEEFNAIAEASPKLMQYLAKGLGVPQTALKKLAENGELTAVKVGNALLKVKADIDRDFLTMPVTVGKAVTNMSTQFSLAIKDIDDTIGITDTLAKKIERTTLNIDAYTQSIIVYYKTTKEFFENNKILIETISKAFDFLGKAGDTTLTIATLDTINNTFKTTKLGANEIIAKLDELEKRKAGLAQNKYKDQNTKAINEQINNLKSQLTQLNNNMLITANDVIPKQKTAIDELLGSYDGYTVLIDQINEVSALRDDSAIIKIMGSELSKFNLELEENVKKLRASGATEAEITQYKINARKEFNEKQNKANQEQIKSAENLNKTYIDIAQIGMSEYDKALLQINLGTVEWINNGVKVKDALAAQSSLLDELNVKTQIATAKEDLSYYERKVQLQSDSLEKELELAGISYSQKALEIQDMSRPIAEKERLLSLEDELYAKTVERIKAEDNIKDIDTALESQTSMLDTQLELLDATDAWGNSFEGIAGTIGNISGAYTKMYKANLVSQKQQISLDAKLAKDKEKYGADSIEYADAVNQHTMDSSKLKVQQQEAEMAGYANLAGAMAGAFEKGSAGAIAFTTLQATLGIASSWTAIATAWALPFPANIPAVAMVAGAVMPIIAQLTSMGGKGGSGGNSSPYSLGEMATAKTIELQDQSVVDRLDQQIALLEAIEKNGSAQKLSVDLAKAEFTQSKNKWVQDVYDISRMGYVNATFSNKSQQWEDIQSYYANKNLTNPYEMNDSNGIRIKSAYFRTNADELISIIADIASANGKIYAGPFGQKLSEELGWGTEATQAFTAQIQATFTEMQGYVNDWAISVVDSVSELKSSADDLRDSYDSITGTTYYADIKLKNAFTDFNSLLKKGESYSDYIKDTIGKIDESSKFIYEFSGILDENGKQLSNYELLLSKNTNLIDEQIAKVDEFGQRVGLTFENGIEEAINYADSIELVSQALVTSRENIKSFEDSFKSDFTLANELAKNIGLNSLATDLESLDSLFIYLKTDTLGLVDAELELLNANKSLIENYNSIISQLDNIISPKTLSLGAVKVEDVTLESANDLLDQLSAAKEAEINRATTAMNEEKDRLQKQKETAQEQKQAADTLKKAFETTTKSLNSTYKNIIGQTSLADSFNITQYQKLYNEIDAGITAGTDISDLTSDFNTYATSYAAYIKDNATTQEEYNRKMKTLANEVKGLAGKAETASLNDLDNRLNDANNNLTSIDSSILSLDTNLQNKIDSINATYISQTQLLKDALAYSFLGKSTSQDAVYSPVATNYSVLIEDAFNTVLGRGTLTQFNDMNFWLEELNSNRVSTQDLYKAIANAAVGFDINGYLANTGDYSLKTITLLSDSVKNAQKYLADNISQTTTTQTTNYYTQNQNDKALDEVVKELQRLNIISAANAENTKKLLKTNKQTLITGLQGA